jgi:hypothetical protein
LGNESIYSLVFMSAAAEAFTKDCRTAFSIAYHAGCGVQAFDRNLLETESVIALKLTEEQLQEVIEKTRSGSGEAFSVLS